LLREEPLGDHHEKADRQSEKREKDHQRGEAEFERDVEAALMAFSSVANRARSIGRSARVGVLRRGQETHASIGVNVSDTTADTAIVIVRVTANSRNSRR